MKLPVNCPNCNTPNKQERQILQQCGDLTFLCLHCKCYLVAQDSRGRAFYVSMKRETINKMRREDGLEEI